MHFGGLCCVIDLPLECLSFDVIIPDEFDYLLLRLSAIPERTASG